MAHGDDGRQVFGAPGDTCVHERFSLVACLDRRPLLFTETEIALLSGAVYEEITLLFARSGS